MGRTTEGMLAEQEVDEAESSSSPSQALDDQRNSTRNQLKAGSIGAFVIDEDATNVVDLRNANSVGSFLVDEETTNVVNLSKSNSVGNFLIDEETTNVVDLTKSNNVGSLQFETTTQAVQKISDVIQKFLPQKISAFCKNQQAFLEESKDERWQAFVALCAKNHEASGMILNWMNRHRGDYEPKLESAIQAERKNAFSALEKKIASWLQKTTIDLKVITSPEKLYEEFCKNHPSDVPLLQKKKAEFMKLFAEAYRVAVEKEKKQEKKEGEDLEKRITAWIAQQKIDLTKVQSGEDLKRLYLQQHPKDKERCDAEKLRFDPLFAAAHKKALEVQEAAKKQAKTDIAKKMDTLLSAEDMKNESLKTKTLFVSAMLARLQSILIQHENPEELERYAKILIEKLHTVWQSKHKALEDATIEEELSEIENAIKTWKPPANKRFANFTAFESAFLQTCTCKELINKHKDFANSVLKLKWAQYAASQDTPGTQSLQQTSYPSVAMMTSVSHSAHAQVVGLSPVLAAALSSTSSGGSANILSESIRSRFRIDWSDISPALASFLHQTQLQVGGERVRRLAQSQKTEELFSGREDNLVPFFLAMCGELQSDSEIPDCVRLLELSDNPKDTMRIMLASDERRRAAFRVRQSPLIWTRFVNALSAIGLSLKDLHLHMDDEDQSETDISTAMVQEVIEEREAPEEEQRDSNISPIANGEELRRFMDIEEMQLSSSVSEDELLEVEGNAYANDADRNHLLQNLLRMNDGSQSEEDVDPEMIQEMAEEIEELEEVEANAGISLTANREELRRFTDIQETQLPPNTKEDEFLLEAEGAHFDDVDRSKLLQDPLRMSDEDQSEEDISTAMVREMMEGREKLKEVQADANISVIASEQEGLEWREYDIDALLYGQSDTEERVEFDDAAYTEQFALSRRFARNNLIRTEAYKQALVMP